MQPDFEKTAAAMIAGAQKAITMALAPVLERIETLEKRAPEKGERGEKGDPGESIKGDTGVGVAGALIDRSGVLVLTLSDGTTRDLGVVVGKDGLDGEDGVDGLPGEPGKDAVVAEESSLTDEETADLVAAALRKELGELDLIVLPELAPVPAKATVPPVHVTVENHLPKRGIEKTVVTKHDERGRVLEFERREI